MSEARRNAMKSFLYYLALSTSFAHAAEVCNGENYQGPIRVPVGRVELEEEGEAGSVVSSSFGTFVELGRSRRNFAMEINAAEKDNYVWAETGENPESCEGDLAPTSCIEYRGGLFDEPDGFSGSDSLYLNGTELRDVPLTATSDKPKNGLGLGRDSSTLEKLKNDGVITSKSWSLWYGRNDPNTENVDVEGHLIFGGIDEMKYETEEEATFPLSTPDERCSTGLVAKIEKITGTASDGSPFNMLDQATDFCIIPNERLLVLPEDSVGLLQQRIESEPTEEPTNDFVRGRRGFFYSADATYGGAIAFDFEKSIKNVTVDDSQLSIVPMTFPGQGNIRLDDSQREILIDTLGSNEESRLPVLGVPFLRSAILTVNYDENEFKLAKYKPSDETSLFPIINNGDNCKLLGSAELKATSSTGLGIAAIVGIAVGVAVFIAIVVLGVCLARRKKSARYNNRAGLLYKLTHLF